MTSLPLVVASPSDCQLVASPSDVIYVLSHSLDTAHSLDRLSSEWDQRRDPLHSLPEYHGEGQNFSLQDLVYDDREFSNSYFWLRV